jgi:hypothetical protein
MYVCIYFSSVGCFANGLQSCQGVMSLSRRDEVSVFIKKDLKIKNKIKIQT